MPTWIRVRDEATGHEYDVEARALPRHGLTPVEGVGPVEGPGAQPRPAKVRVAKDGTFAPPKPDDPAAARQTSSGGVEQEQPADEQDQQEAPADQPADTTSKRSKR